MEFFDKLGKKASDAYKVTADKTGKLAKEAKLRMKMSELKGNINDIYEEIGKAVYENHLKEKKEKLDKVFEEKCTQIDVLSDEIKTMEEECLQLKDKKKCPECFTEMEKETKFCPNCGTEQPVIEEAEEATEAEGTEVKETEVVEESKEEKSKNSKKK